MGRTLRQPTWRWRFLVAACLSESLLRRRFPQIQMTGPFHGNLHSLARSGVGAFGGQSHEPAHGGDLILVLLHAPGEGSAVFRTDQRLRRTHTLSHVGHVELVSVDHVVKVATPLFPDTKTVNTLGGITSEGV